MRIAAIAALLLATLGCREVVSPFDVGSVPAAVVSHQSGAWVVEVTNAAPHEWALGSACAHDVERLEAGAWTVVRSRQDHVCFASVLTVGPGETEVWSWGAPESQPGTYRLRFYWSYWSDAGSVHRDGYSDAFLVRE
jgi:hypothetical protein